jgi:hypothetical protein
MDLGTILEKLKSHSYPSEAEVREGGLQRVRGKVS